MSEAVYIVRQVQAEDLPMIEQWAVAHGHQIIHALLSPHGFLCEKYVGDEVTPMLVIWGFMMLDVPVIQLDFLYSAPGTKISEVRLAWEALQTTIRDWVRIINEDSGLHYQLLRVFLNKRVAQEAARAGWVIGETEHVICLHHV